LDSNIGDLDGLTFLSKAPVIGVRLGTPAEKAGLKTGDRILSINGAEVKHYRDLDTMMLPHQGQDVTFKIERSPTPESATNEKLEIKATFEVSLQFQFWASKARSFIFLK
jgi:C-terminal processing protease CtpA/Prc